MVLEVGARVGCGAGVGSGAGVGGVGGVGVGTMLVMG